MQAFAYDHLFVGARLPRNICSVYLLLREASLGLLVNSGFRLPSLATQPEVTSQMKREPAILREAADIQLRSQEPSI